MKIGEERRGGSGRGRGLNRISSNFQVYRVSDVIQQNGSQMSTPILVTSHWVRGASNPSTHSSLVTWYVPSCDIFC